MTANETFDQALKYISREGVDDLVVWLKQTDFFIAPASTNFHGNYEGGLLDHSIYVTRFALHNFNFIVKEKPDLEYLRESVVICGLFHDVCKVNYYNKEQKWYKDEQNKWKEYYGWNVKDEFPLGHGEKSIYFISKFIKLTNPEAMAIRWHMGSSEISVNLTNTPQNYAYQQAIDHPLVRLIHCADMLAMTIEEKRDLKK